MNLQEYNKEFLEDIKSQAVTNMSNENEEFLRKYTEYLIECEEISDFHECYFEAEGLKRKHMMIEGYNYEEADSSYSLFVSDLEIEDEIETMNKAQINKLQGKMIAFLDHATSGYIRDNIEESSEAYSVAMDIKKEIDKLSKIKLYIVTNKKLSDRIKNIDSGEVLGVKVETRVWDINRLFNLVSSTNMKENIEINFEEIGVRGLQAIMAVKSEEKEYTSFLTTIKGNVLADLYIEYGSRLLEGNVRSFLSTRGKVNKDIRKTILTEPEMFFAYNNGIAATATAVALEENEFGTIIVGITDLQIINGGQTTASIANAVLQDKHDVSNIIVPMKLSVVNAKKAEEIIPTISRCANSQNKVNEADFFSNHPYHIRMEELSRKIYAPATNGNQYETLWFYERARGQHAQEQMKLTKGQRDKYLLQKPKNQLLKKVDLAKFINSYNGNPHIVSKGAQANMRYFAEMIEKEWKGNEDTFENEYYKRAIALSIIFKETEKLVSEQEWYKAIKSYRANIVTYSIAVLFNYIKNKNSLLMVDFNRVWLQQTIYKELRAQLITTTKEVYDFITSDDRTTLNVTEWCKKEMCWTKAKKYNFTMNKGFLDTLVRDEKVAKVKKNTEDKKEEIRYSKAQVEVFEKGKAFWKKILEKAIEYKVAKELEEEALRTVLDYFEFDERPSVKQAEVIMKLLKRLQSDGFIQ
ncbi:MAG: AIPR family protein [Sarcina sp.]